VFNGFCIWIIPKIVVLVLIFRQPVEFTEVRIGYTNGILSPLPLDRNSENTPFPIAASTAPCESGGLQGGARLCAVWSGHAGQDGLQ
jgi:hypothetical protein